MNFYATLELLAYKYIICYNIVMSRKGSRLGNKTTDYRQRTKGYVDPFARSIEDFMVGGPEKQRDAVARLERGGGRLPLLVAGEMALDLASRTQGDTQLGFIGRANDSWRRVVDSEIAAGDCKSSTLGIRAGLYLAQLRSYSWLLTQQQLAPPDQATKVYGNMLGWTRLLLEQKLANHNFSSARDRSDTYGVASEVIVNLLLKRFGIAHAPGETDATPSFFRQDQGGTRWKTDNPKWDVSGWMQLDASPPVLDHKVQVKYSNNGPVVDYADDIAVVTVQTDLALGSRPVSAQTILRELLGDAGYDAEPNLDARTEKLFDRLESAHHPVLDMTP